MLEITWSRRANYIDLLAFTGELDLFEKDQVAGLLRDEIQSRPNGVILDLSSLSFLDSSGIGVLISYRIKLQEYGIPMVIVTGADNKLRQKLNRLMGPIESTILLAETVEEAERVIGDHPTRH